MPLLSKSKIDNKILNLSEVAILNSLSDPQILQKVEKFGYNSSKLNEGKQLLEDAKEKYNRNIRITGEQEDKTESFIQTFEIAKQAYQDLAKVARAVFKGDKGKLAQLGLESKMPRSVSAFIAAAQTLFENASKIDEIKNILSNYGYDDGKFKIEKIKINQLQEANNIQEAAKGEAQNSTKEKDKAIKDLYDWVIQYMKIARVALKDNKQLLEKIAVRVYSQKTAKQRQAPKKAALTKKNKKPSS